MKYAFWGFGLLMAGIFGLMFILMFESITVNNESEYYSLKEAMEASMLESIDLACAPAWMTIDRDSLKITFDRLPEREELDPEFKEQLVIEYYSK